MAELRWQCEICKKTYEYKGEADECEKSHPKIVTAYEVKIDPKYSDSSATLTVHTELQTYRFLIKLPGGKF